MRELPKIGTGVWIRKDSKLLLGVRAKEKGTGAGEWCPPGGPLEMHESLEECAIREAREETGLEIQNVRFLMFSEDPASPDKQHYITFHYAADLKSGTLLPQEGEYDHLEWFEWDKLPQPLFRPTQLFVATGINPLTT